MHAEYSLTLIEGRAESVEHGVDGREEYCALQLARRRFSAELGCVMGREARHEPQYQTVRQDRCDERDPHVGRQGADDRELVDDGHRSADDDGAHVLEPRAREGDDAKTLRADEEAGGSEVDLLKIHNELSIHKLVRRPCVGTVTYG